jgi:hypothetical protein
MFLDSVSRIDGRLARLRQPAVDLPKKRQYLIGFRRPYNPAWGMADGVQKVLPHSLQHKSIPDGQQPSCGGRRKPAGGHTCAKKLAA